MDGEFRTHLIDIDPPRDTDALLGREWLLTNGAGSYAMGTALGCNTRRYHGLLIAAGAMPGSRPPVGRAALLNQMWEQVELTRAEDAPPGAAGSGSGAPAAVGEGGVQTLNFTALAFRGGGGERVFSPRGHTMLRRFERGLGVAWTYRWGRIVFERRVLMHWKRPAVTIRYRVTGLDAPRADQPNLLATLRLRPMVTLRDFHALLHEGDPRPWTADAHGGEYITIRGGEAPGPALTLHSSHGSFEADGGDGRGWGGGDWWRRVTYAADAERGQGDQEDYLLPCTLAAPIGEAVEVAVTAALGDEPVEPIADLAGRAERLGAMVGVLRGEERGAKGEERSAKREERGGAAASLPYPALALAADDFVVDRTIGGEVLSTILAGYPWFFDWGRDTFIALPGLLLCTGRFDEARRTLRAFADAIRGGLVPNRFDDYGGDAHYNTADASLWFIHAAIRYVEATGDTGAWRDWLAPACLGIVDAYVRGTDHGIAMDADGLVAAGNPHTQLTWMDAQCGGAVFTPRWGKAVEINALWHSTLTELGRLSVLEHAAEKTRLAACAELAQKVRRSFPRAFWNEAGGCLYDHLRPGDNGSTVADPTLRPNQIFAVSLPHSPLPARKQQRVLSVVRDRLLTPMGLRTLPVDDPDYHGRYSGPQPQRDEAYHQGTIWPWLIGPYAEAVLRVGGFSDAARAQARAVVAPLLEQVAGHAGGILGAGTTPGPGGCLGQIAEICEPDTLRPVGCPAQAWSVAQVVRLTQMLA